HWLGNKKRPEDCGCWERTNSRLQHVKTLKPLAPDSILYARYPASVRRGAQEIAAVVRSDCFVQCNNREIQVINSDEEEDGKPILPDDLVEASLSLHVEDDTGDLSKDIGP
ncbi:hypothetical protein AVEN_135359-1, partial [Araneus ventricosus]